MENNRVSYPCLDLPIMAGKIWIRQQIDYEKLGSGVGLGYCDNITYSWCKCPYVFGRGYCML